MSNRYPGTCDKCGTRVRAYKGVLIAPTEPGSPWIVRHESCADGSETSARPARSDRRYRGRCEDAPCCGCCDTGSGYGYTGGM